MKIQKQLTRKPLTTALWTILVTAMAMLLGVDCALLYSSGSLAGILDGYHTSIAVRTDMAKSAGHSFLFSRWRLMHTNANS